MIGAITGIDATIAGLNDAVARARKGAQRGAQHAMEVMRKEMVKRTPVDEGILRGTVHLANDGPDWHGNVLEGAWVAGGPSADYAEVQHERTDFHHTVGQAKFISSVAEEQDHTIPEAMATAIRAELGG